MRSFIKKIIESRPFLGLTTQLIILSAFFIILAATISAFVQHHQSQKQAIEQLQKKINDMAKSESIPLSVAIWDLDQDKVQLHLQGILSIPSVEEVSIIGENYKESAGKIISAEIIKKTYPLKYFDPNNQGELKLGDLIIVAGVNEIKLKAWENTQKFLVSEIIQIITICFFMILLFETLVTLHIKNLTKHLIRLRENNNFRQVALDRPNLFYDEFTLFVDALNALTKKRAEQNYILDEKAKQKAIELKTILENIDAGLVIILPNLKIQQEYSRVLPSIVGVDITENDHITDVLFNKSHLTKSEIEIIEKTLKDILGSHSSLFDLKKDKLPEEISISVSPTQKKYFKLIWAPIISHDNFVKKIILNLREDNFKNKFEKIDSLQEELSLLGEIIHLHPKLFENFFNSFKTILNKNIRIMKELSQLNEGAKNFDSILKNLTSLSEISHDFKLKTMSSTLDKIILSLSHSSDNEIYKNLEEAHTIIKEKLRKYLIVQGQIPKENSFLSIIGKSKRLIGIDEKVAPKFSEYLSSLKKHYLDSEDRKKLKKIEDFFSLMQANKLKNILYQELCKVPDIAQSRGIPVPKILISDKNFYIKSLIQSEIQLIFGHLIRNSLFHGIELPHIRKINGKESDGLIEIFVGESSGFYFIRYRDDGKGINVKEIEKMAKEKKIIDSEDRLEIEKLLNLILLPEITTTREQRGSELFGKGQGLNFVKEIIKKLEGSIQVQLVPRPRKFADYCYPFEIIINLPSNYFLTKKTSDDA